MPAFGKGGRGSAAPDDKAAEPRKGTPDRKLAQEEFRRRFLSQFRDQAFAPQSDALEKIAAAAWDAYSHHRKSPRTRKAGAGFHDPDYDLAVDWIVAHEAVQSAQARHDDPSGPSRLLLIAGSARSEHTCPGEMSKSYRLVEIARETIASAPGVETEVLALDRLTSEYGQHIHPCKACFSTSPALCHWPYATSHAALDADTSIQEEVRNAAHTLLEAVNAKRTGLVSGAGEQLKAPRQK